MIMKKTVCFTLIALAAVVFSGCTLAGQNNGQTDAGVSDPSTAGKAVVYFFWGEGCPHCTTQKPFLEEMKDKYSGLEVKEYETYKNPENAALFKQMAAAYGTRAQGVPSTFIGDGEPFVGFSESMKADMENKIKLCIEQGCTDPGSKL